MKVLSVFGTRPEAIKMASVIKTMEGLPDLEHKTCVTAQHRHMLDQVLNIFDIKPDYDLDIMKPNQDLFTLTGDILNKLRSLLMQERPDIVLVQGDTTTAFAAGLGAFYLKIPIGHIEAGLRTYDKYSPFPEEINRHLLSVLSDYHFAPTDRAKANLVKEGVSASKIWVTGNTVIDSLLWVIGKQQVSKSYYRAYFENKWQIFLEDKRKLILVTGHRRENFGEGFRNICMALKALSSKAKDVMIVYPVHLNPNVQKPVRELLGDEQSIRLIEPLDYEHFVFLMSQSYIVLTDSGGIQEEAPSLGKPVLVLRNITERLEGVEAGTVKVVGTDTDRIIEETLTLIENRDAYEIMSKAANPYGDGTAAKKITDIICSIKEQ
ncbi:UDP-N-acetylglucosamine 2-epimerase [Candidatus Magnetoovum chiemensis]|nr:UDP-N-acetylglucosamine 2-epimerase [Candidatus Magnetoovum chiemensis]